MEKISAEKLLSLKLCDATAETKVAGGNICILLHGTDFKRIVFRNASVTEMRILGYEVLNEDEEVVFEMPDVEILGDKIPDALATLNECHPFVVEFRREDDSLVFVLNDDTDTYEIDIDYSDAEAE